MHFAALAYVGESVTDPAKYYHNNVGGSLSLLEAMRAAGVRTSSSPAPRPPTASRSACRSPRRAAAADQSLRLRKLVVERDPGRLRRGLRLRVRRPALLQRGRRSPDGDLGEDHDPETHLIPLVLQVALGQREKITIFGTDYPTPDGTCIRDYVHVDDLADGPREGARTTCSPARD